jgi:hypothetical protein
MRRPVSGMHPPRLTHAPPGNRCPFCAVARGEENPPWTLRGDIVHRDERMTAWINRRWWANNPGAAVVVPNDHVENIYALVGPAPERQRPQHQREERRAHRHREVERKARAQ